MEVISGESLKVKERALKIYQKKLRKDNIKVRQSVNDRGIKIIQKYGHSYYLVKSEYRGPGYPKPNFMGYEGYALRSIDKLL